MTTTRALPAVVSAEPLTRSPRVTAIDVIRGAVMVLMAIDHVRVFSGLPAGGPTPGIFFTRWITHFCAPAFVFLAGTSAFLYGRKHGDLSRFLLTRGIWLVLLELTVVRFAWTFNFDYASYMMAGVLWAIGWSMIVLAGLAKLPIAAIASFGILLIAGHNLMDPHWGELVPKLAESRFSALWKILYLGFFAGPFRFGSAEPNFIVLYSLVPWIGVMAAGYAFGRILIFLPERRDRWCVAIGLGSIGLFLLLRGFNLYGDPRPWSAVAAPLHEPPRMPGWLSFLNTTKYPASFAFLLMTLGPTVALLPLANRCQSRVCRWLRVFGRVPFFFYLLHIPLIHIVALVVSKVRLGTVTPWLFTNHPMGNPPAPEGYTWNLALLYAVWGLVTVMLYFACRWYADFKKRRPGGWSRYV